jgi:hypothetical protein
MAEAAERTIYAQLSDEELDQRADYKIDVNYASVSSRYWGEYGAFVKRRFLWWSWWACVFADDDLERCTEYLQTLIQLPRRYTRKVVPKP